MKHRILWFESGDLYTVRRGVEAGEKRGVRVVALEPIDLTFVADEQGVGARAWGRDIVAEFDALIMRSFMPNISESLLLARLFRAAGKVVVDESTTDEGYVISKMHDYVVLAQAGVAVPNTRQFFDVNDALTYAHQLSFPCVVKGIYGAEGRHVHRVECERDVRKLFLQYKPGELMLQEFLAADVDYRVMVVGGEALPFYVSRKPREGEFRTNFEWSETITAHPLSERPDLADLAQRAAKALRREFSGVDIRCRGNVPVVLEANRRPGFKAFEQATQFDVAGAFIDYVVRKINAATHTSASSIE